MPCFAEPHKYCLCGVLLMAIVINNKEVSCVLQNRINSECVEFYL